MMRKSLIALNDSKAPASEAYRMIRTNLEYTSIDRDKKVILFTSAKTKEGKTTTVVNLAITLAHSKHKVLLIDCDLRKPRIHKLFDLSNEYGVVNLLAKNKELNEVIQKVAEIENLEVMTSGPIPPMPAELLSSDRMKALISDLSKNYDYILIDTPPVLSVTDAMILANMVDGVVLVVATGQTHMDAIKTAQKSLEKVNANILGVILSKAERGKNAYYYYHYDYNYGEDQKKKKGKIFKPKKVK